MLGSKNLLIRQCVNDVYGRLSMSSEEFYSFVIRCCFGSRLFCRARQSTPNDGSLLPCLQEEMLLRAECLDAKQEEGF